MRPPPSIVRAALFVADVLASVVDAPFLKKWGIKDKRYKARLVSKLRTQHSLAPAPRSGRPRVYTPEQLAAGQVALAAPSQPYHSTAALLLDLKEQQILPASATRRGYGNALKRHLGQQGLALGYSPRAKAQPLTDADKQQRLAWCQHMRLTITAATVQSWWFEDEKQHNYGGKARGEQGWARSRC